MGLVFWQFHEIKREGVLLWKRNQVIFRDRSDLSLQLPEVLLVWETCGGSHIWQQKTEAACF